MKSFSQTRKHLEESSILYAQSLEIKQKKTSEKPDIDAPAEKEMKTPVSSKIQSALVNRIATLRLNDGSQVEVDPKDADALIGVREELNSQNQELFDTMLTESIDSFCCALDFARIYRGN